MLKGSLRGAKPLLRGNPPLPLVKGKGIKACPPHTCPPYKTLAGGRLWQAGDGVI